MIRLSLVPFDDQSNISVLYYPLLVTTRTSRGTAALDAALLRDHYFAKLEHMLREATMFDEFIMQMSFVTLSVIIILCV